MIVRKRREENLSFRNQKAADNFLTYMTSQGYLSFMDMPLCCQHVSIAYFILNRQNHNNIDPTANGRRIKRAHIMVGL